MYILQQADFITETTPMYFDPEGNAPYKVRIEKLPLIGVLKYNGVAATVGLVLDYMIDVGGGKLTYEKDETVTAGYSTQFDFRVADVGSERYSNVGTITFTIKRQFSAPNVDDNSGNLISKVFTFGESSFTNNFADADGDGYHEVIIESLPIVPELKLLGGNVTVGTRFLAVNASGLKFNLPDSYAIYNDVLYKFNESIDKIVTDYNNLGYNLTENSAGKLTFTSGTDPSDVVFIQGTVIPNSSLQFNFKVTDDSDLHAESNVATFSLIPQGNVNIKTIYTNEPPIVGDNEVGTRYTVPYEFDRSDFIEDTQPKFYDPNGDQPYELRVDSLPPNGVLYYNSIAVVVGDIFPFVGGIDDKKLTYVPDTSRMDIPFVEFDFSVSDTGTKTFSS